MACVSAVYDLLVDELEAYPDVLNIRGETVRAIAPGPGPLLAEREALDGAE